MKRIEKELKKVTNLCIHAEVEIPLCNKTLVTFSLVSITVSSDNHVYYFILGLK